MNSFQFSVFSFQRRVILRTRYSALPTPHSPLPTRARSGISLIEVLASIGVISIGLLGLASLLPVGLVTIFEATKSDRAGNCGRAAMREIVVRRMLDYRNWYDPVLQQFINDPNYNGGSNYSKSWYDQNGNVNIDKNGNPFMPASFIIDPLGVTNNAPQSLGDLNKIVNPPATFPKLLPRITLVTPATALQKSGTYSAALSDTIFRATDDIIATAPENMTPAQPPGRPIPMPGTLPNTIASQGDYSWFATVTPNRTTPSRFEVAVVVCYRRTLNPSSPNPSLPAAAEQAQKLVTIADFLQVNNTVGISSGGGSVILGAPIGSDTIRVRQNNWVALCEAGAGLPTYGLCHWYRVDSVSDDGTDLMLIGPDWRFLWTSSPSPQLIGLDYMVAVGQDVIGVYTTTVDVDSDATWTN
jgi:hypothetical protein